MVRSSYVRKLRFNDVGFWFVIVRYFVLLNNYVTLGLQKHEFLKKPDIHHFFVRSGDVWKVRHNYLASWFVNLLYLFLRQKYVINAFLTMTYVKITLGLRSFVVRCIMYENNVWNNVWKLRFVFVLHCDVFFISSQIRYLFVWCSYNFWWR